MFKLTFWTAAHHYVVRYVLLMLLYYVAVCVIHYLKLHYFHFYYQLIESWLKQDQNIVLLTFDFSQNSYPSLLFDPYAITPYCMLLTVVNLNQKLITIPSNNYFNQICPVFIGFIYPTRWEAVHSEIVSNLVNCTLVCFAKNACSKF